MLSKEDLCDNYIFKNKKLGQDELETRKRKLNYTCSEINFRFPSKKKKHSDENWQLLAR